VLTCEPDVCSRWVVHTAGDVLGGVQAPRPVGHSYTEPGIDGRRLPGREPGITMSIADTITPSDGAWVRRGEVPAHQLVSGLPIPTVQACPVCAMHETPSTPLQPKEKQTP